ncbi:hypothetical protein ACVNP3_10410 [Pseudomonas chlororaphis subsp. piscium]
MSNAINKFSTIDASAYGRLTVDSKRSVAVGAALELILAKASAQTSGVDLAHDLSQLSDYADKIQDALKAK